MADPSHPLGVDTYLAQRTDAYLHTYTEIQYGVGVTDAEIADEEPQASLHRGLADAAAGRVKRLDWLTDEDD